MGGSGRSDILLQSLNIKVIYACVIAILILCSNYMCFVCVGDFQCSVKSWSFSCFFGQSRCLLITKA